MDHSNYDPYQDLSQPYDPHAHGHDKQGKYGMVQQQTELPDVHYDEDFHKRPRPGVTTSTEAAEFRQIRWPDGPRFLVTSILFDTLTFVLEGLLVLIALAFLCLAILACRWSDMPSDSELVGPMEQAMKLVRCSFSGGQCFRANRATGSYFISHTFRRSCRTCPQGYWTLPRRARISHIRELAYAAH